MKEKLGGLGEGQRNRDLYSGIREAGGSGTLLG